MPLFFSILYLPSLFFYYFSVAQSRFKFVADDCDYKLAPKGLPLYTDMVGAGGLFSPPFSTICKSCEEVTDASIKHSYNSIATSSLT